VYVWKLRRNLYLSETNAKRQREIDEARENR
jgi:hypothetical protein